MALKKKKKSDGTVYWMTDLRMNGRRICEYAAIRHRDAQIIEDERKREIRAGTYVPRRERIPEKEPDPPPPAPARITFRDFIEKRFFPEYAKQRRSDYYEDASKPLVTFFGDFALEEIKPADVDRYRVDRAAKFLERRGRTIGSSTMRKELMILGTIYKTARRWELVDVDPLVDVAKPKEPKHRLLYLTWEQWQLFAAELAPWARPMAALAVCTGMRLLEVVSLRWIDLDGVAGIISVPEGKTERRAIPMLEPVRRLLEAQSVRGDFVFTDDTGLPHTSTRSRNRITQASGTAMRRIGIPGGFHTLRHTAASWMVQAGRPLYEVQGILGHKDPKMTMKYAHLAPGHLSAGLAVLSPALDTQWIPAGLIAGAQTSALALTARA